MRTNAAPQQILVNNTEVSPANSLSTFESATGSSWYFDSANTLLYLKVKHAGGTANLVANFSAAPPTITPTITSTPTLTPTATATLGAGGAELEVRLNGVVQGSPFSVGKSQSLPVSYPGVNNGAVKILSTNNVPVVAQNG